MIPFPEAMQITSTVSSITAFDDDECRALYDLCCQVRHGGIVVEIGCQMGRSSSIILQCARDRYHSFHIDPWVEDPAYREAWMRMAHGIGVPHAVFSMTTEQWMRLPLKLRHVDLMLIDGDHERDGVRIDTEVADDIISDGGILCAHDYRRDSLPAVTEVLDKFAVTPEWTLVNVAGTLGVWRRNG